MIATSPSPSHLPPTVRPEGRVRFWQWLVSPLVAGFIALLVLLPLFVSLGQWQWQKGERKAAEQALRDARGSAAALSLPRVAGGSGTSEALQFRRLELNGRFLPERQFLLDNQVQRQRAGFHVLTPFRPDGSDAVVRVNRGWLPAGANHRDLPAIATPSGGLHLNGVAVLPPRRFFSLAATGNNPDWQGGNVPVWQTLDLDAFARQSGLAVHGLILQLDAAAPAGFERQWPRPDERIERHYSYALQWYGFALAALGIWLFFLARKLWR
ncbi:MAG TPA: SURF1 family protein [Rhodocyclaceae bacterium]|nr:SURF1 family protein [Rhodocyclaceae bacterium]